MQDLDPHAIARSPVVAAFAGAAVAALAFSLPGASWKERLINVVAGTAISYFLTPGLTEYLKINTVAYAGGAGFFVGMVGVSLLTSLFKAWRETEWTEILKGWISRRN